ncbi:T9SS type A sorting domain-containing protein [Aequorivita antarctica]|uniref:T9SS type A sorting domain-containing protein n=1 Tax=Aequorivita antarctica TaxID=153266 RepID=A0A5C6YUV6_9FLAO|nr:T9SS type A sorting domain-containing protein [Aequorivita antarctica]TXD71323.1 T9SS type A sorting domain-containing protein [Aequorivita antarctica]SRX76454.1 hypothetical protein AEQU3_03454 [Aequorivita antarctica]
MKKILFTTIVVFAFFSQANAQVGFQPHTIIDQGNTNGPRAVFSADLDGDGLLDVVSTSEYDKKVAWYKNDGAGNLGAQQIISLNEVAPSSGNAADIDGDGIMDILVGSTDINKAVWFKNNGSASFGPPQLITTSGDGITNAIAEDLDGDGDLDVIVTSFRDDKVSWYENINGAGAFGPENIISTSLDFARKIAASDLDGDGDLDLLSISFYGHKVVWYENLDGQGTFSNEHIVDNDISRESSIYGFDVDADGDNDIVTNKSGNAGIVYYENLNGQGNFSAARIITTDDAGSFVIDDIDLDGDMDLVSTVGNLEIAWYENTNGQGNFGNKQTLASTDRGGYYILNMADINNNGRLDILTANFYKDKIAWYPSDNGQVTYQGEIILSTIHAAQGVYDVHAADVDGDGFLDAVSTNVDAETITWFKNTNGQGNFGPAQIIGENILYGQSIYPADLDGDGDIDIISSSDPNGYASWYKNTDGLGNFTIQSFPANTETSTFVYADDLDGDGDMDVIIGGSFDSGIFWLENLNSLGSFSQPKIVEEDLGYTEAIYTADLDGDGDLDITTAVYNDDFFAWYENLDGQGNFGPRIIIEANVNGSFSLYPSDLDGDGDMDIIGSVIHEDLVVWYENTDGQATFSTRKILAENIPAAERIKTFDADQDGDLDILISDFVERTYSWFENTDGLGTLGQRHILDSNINGALGNATGDFDGNGKIDILTGSLRSDSIKWYENLGPLGVEENTYNTIALYPIPSSDVLNIKSTSTIVEVIVYNELGQRLLNIENKEGINSLNIAALSNGIYFIRLKDFDQNNVTKKFIKQE